ncbi:A24 family peptidase [Cellulomonas sp. P24]|uniref:prepilin peptidase n=1 Tax=Cellulomonas sp. P24 TaxID=2885206 RepID=UPI00216B468C|nr:A24 family peptidase [Cellulomonas sp. P24]MCR6494603.1 prepilin peptidase [Cellulomonas sp. P24]
MTWYLLSVAGAFGLVIGSFVNVVVWRVPRGESVVRPPSACPVCHASIRAWDNVPVVSWVLLRGRCRDCGTRISRRYPLVEATTGVLFVLVAIRFLDAGDLAWAAPAYLYLAAVAVALALIDIDTHRLPNAIVLPSIPVMLLLLGAASAVTGDWSRLGTSVLGGVVLFALYAAMVVAYPRGMGLGDVKLAAVIGVALGWLGWGPLAVGAFAAFLLGGGFSVTLLALRRANRKTALPFGPWMLAGAGVGIAAGAPLWSAYLGLFA